MAGKDTGAWESINLPGFQWNPKTTKAYAEGRSWTNALGGSGSNPHAGGSEAHQAWTDGFIGRLNTQTQFETAIVLGEA